MANGVGISEHDVPAVLQDAQQSFEINVVGVLKTIYAFLPLVREGKLKKIVAISSGMGDIGKSANYIIAQDFRRCIRRLS